MMNLFDIATAVGVKGFLHCNEAQKLAELAINRDVLEIGSFTGLSAYLMAITAKTVMCVDTFKANTAGQQQLDSLQTLDAFQKATSRFSNVNHFIGTSEQASKPLSENESIQGHFDMIFLDAMHTYEDVKADIERWWPRVRPGGVMAFHDYRHLAFPGVEKAVDEKFGPAPEGTTVVTLRWIQKT